MLQSFAETLWYYEENVIYENIVIAVCYPMSWLLNVYVSIFDIKMETLWYIEIKLIIY